MYHIANGVALTEYLLTLYFKPALKSYQYVSLIGTTTHSRGLFR
jgi:protein-S-isoprenylcysteine O-methyltransferase